MTDAVIFDMDGTLANVQAIRHYVVRPYDLPAEAKWHANFEMFHRAACSAFTEPNAEVLEALRTTELAPLIVSARTEKWKRPSLRWLEAKLGSAPWREVCFRGDKDFRPDTEVKRDIYDALVAKGYNIVEAWDDNPAIVALWHELSVKKVNVVPGWNDERVSCAAAGAR